ncbi:uncharacterized protein LOC135924405 [Gordionus sp. m RMFG-2023]|uniref:uncharacterized protein LOC135924405 n=1 Tax=Gordionus sp. m RMFG-2023 TaxID=3053472 RepID=UPI0031FDA0A7
MENTVYGKLLIGSLNINGLNNKLVVLLRDYASMKLDIIGIQETHNPGNTTADFNEYKLFCSGITLNSWYNIIILGDLRIGKNEEYDNNIIGSASMQQINKEDSIRLLDFCRTKNLKIVNTFFNHNEINTFTFMRANQKSQIDFFISNIHEWFEDVKVSTNIKLSDHRLVVAKMFVKNIWKYHHKNSPNTLGYRVNSLKPILPRKQIKAHSHENLQILDQALKRKRDIFLNTTENRNVNAVWNLFKRNIIESHNTLPNVNIFLRKEWITNETVIKINQLREGNILNKDLWKDIQKRLRSDRRTYIAKKAFEIDKDMKDNRIYDAYNKLNYFCKPYSFKKIPSLVLKNGKQDEQLALWVDYYMRVFDSRKAFCQTSTSVRSIPPPSGFSTDEIKKAITKLCNNNKAPGLDEITAEHLKSASNTISSYLLPLFNKIWDSGETPKECNISLLCNFPKIKDPKSFKDYRAIALTFTVSKIFMVLIKNRILSSRPTLLPKYICAYRPKRNMLELILALKIIIQKCWKYKINAYLILC